MQQPPAEGLDDVAWQRSYDRASIERFKAEVSAERARLESEIDAARARITAAETAVADQQREAATLGALVLAAQRDLADMEDEHARLVSSIRAAADAEAARVVAAARAEAAAMRATASLMAQHAAEAEGTHQSVDEVGPPAPDHSAGQVTRADAG